MSDQPRLSIEAFKARTGTAVPTGPALLAFVQMVGAGMLADLQRGRMDRYRETKDFYIQLLEIAQNDSYCSPILIKSVQAVLDEESALYRAGHCG